MVYKDLLEKIPNFGKTKLESLSDLDILKNYLISIRRGLPIWYRGQNCSSYDLIPGLFRKQNHSSEKYKEIESKIILQIKKSKFYKTHCDKNHEKYKGMNKNIWYDIFQLQHLGFPTRLLDWTIDPKMAMYFASDDEFDKDGAFWIHFIDPIAHDGYGVDYFSETKVKHLNPDFYINKTKGKAEAIRECQFGNFMYQPYHENQYPLNYYEQLLFFKIIVSKEFKKNILNSLKELEFDKKIFNKDDELKEYINKLKIKFEI